MKYTINSIMEQISAHNALHTNHGRNCSCHDRWSGELKAAVMEVSNSQKDINSFALLCHYFVSNPPQLASTEEVAQSPSWHPTKEELEAQSPQAYISETDKVFCSDCWEEAQEDNVGDQDPNCWLHATKPWSNHVCDCCGSTDGHPAF